MKRTFKKYIPTRLSLDVIKLLLILFALLQLQEILRSLKSHELYICYLSLGFYYTLCVYIIYTKRAIRERYARLRRHM